MRDELDELRAAITSGDYSQAFAIIDELDEMSRSDKINKIHSYMGVLLLHLIKQAAEQRLTKSWRRFINFSLRRIARTNKRDKVGGYYLDDDGLAEELADAWTDAIEQAALEAFEGVYEADELARMVSQETILADALERIREAQG
jgi:hypothetical protein